MRCCSCFFCYMFASFSLNYSINNTLFLFINFSKMTLSMWWGHVWCEGLVTGLQSVLTSQFFPYWLGSYLYPLVCSGAPTYSTMQCRLRFSIIREIFFIHITVNYLNMAIKCCMVQTRPSSSVSYIHICKMRDKKICRTRSGLYISRLQYNYHWDCTPPPLATNVVNYYIIKLLFILIKEKKQYTHIQLLTP